ncbi:protein kinase [Saccharomycopsis crataegensis]|uniref:Protein kinase n=1 Tax=Saccharomycopsis crataegensis TaxID=43959 RepID=A0AAV5QSE6_9ASCO|nr:protein kinase [Saccharomycopsis crataegensis]
MITNGPANFDVLENIKENILPLDEGRSATTLARIFSMPTQELKQTQIEERKSLELQINNCEDCDDPLEPYLNYIRWINNNFPQGPNVANGLVPILEKCTSYFKDYSIYKNDPRYMRIWVLYAKYSENSINVFVFLHRKEIGNMLSLYYEEYAKVLESQNRFDQANQVFQKGLLNEAKPVRRLQNKYNEFRQRMISHSQNPDENQDITDPFDPFPKRQALAMKGGYLLDRENEHNSGDEEQPELGTRVEKSKLPIYVDNGDGVDTDPLGRTGGWDDLGTIASRTKENKLSATPWVGETLKQHKSATEKKKPPEKVLVYRDGDARHDANVPVYKTIENIGKNTEKLDVNLDLLHPMNGEEFCISEILALMRGNYGTKYDILQEEKAKTENVANSFGEQDNENNSLLEKLDNQENFGLGFGGINDDEDELNDLYCSDDENVPHNIFKNDKATTEPSKISPSRQLKTITGDISVLQKSSPTVTMTMYSKEANKEVYSMFNQKIGKVNLDTFAPKNSDGEDTLGNNLDDFTEHTNHLTVLNNLQPKKLESFTPSRNKTGERKEKPKIHIFEDDEIDKLGNEVAELSVIEYGGEQGGDDESGQQVPNDENNPFLFTPIKRPLNDTSRKGSPFVKKKLKNSEATGSFLLDDFINEKPESLSVIDPFDEKNKSEILTKLQPKIDKLEGFFKYNSNKGTFKNLKSLASYNSNASLQQRKKAHKFISFEKTDELNSIIKELGLGGFGMVFLAESSKDGGLKALKVQSPANLWEFYIIKEIKERLKNKVANMLSFSMRSVLTRIMECCIIDAKKLHYYRDESYLMLAYENQGTIVDMLNIVKEDASSKDCGIPELLVIHLSIDLINIIQALHDIKILHGDLKADNCMIKFTNTSSRAPIIDSREAARQYLDSKGITLVDFGRAIDLTMFSENIKFKTSLQQVDIEQDCPQIQNNQQWKYEIDYYGLANIIHTMLFGKYAEVVFENESYHLKNRFKRYWKSELWVPLFDFLLNPVKSIDRTNHKNPGKILKEHRMQLETYLLDESNGFRNVKSLQNVISDLEYQLKEQFK